MKDARLYIRVSNDDQVLGHSLGNQEQMLIDYCKLKGVRPVELIREEGFTGRNTKRPGFRKLMDSVRPDECVVVYSLTRFGRNTLDTLTALQKFEKMNVGFHSLKENVDTTSAMGKFFLTVMAALATLESDQISERVKDVKAYLKNHGRVYSSPPLGFDAVNGELIPNKEQEIVNMVYQQFQKGEGYSSIAGILNENGILTKKGKKFAPITVKRILTNKIYEKFPDCRLHARST